MTARTFRRAALGVLLLALAGCASVSSSPSRQQRVDSKVAVGPLLAVRLEPLGSQVPLAQSARSLFFPNDERCNAVLTLEQVIEYVPSGLMGTARRADQECEAVGIASLTEWRDRRPRARTRLGDDTGQAQYRVVVDLPDHAILRGRFPKVGLLGWSGGEDTFAVVGKSEACRDVLGRDIATIVYKQQGSPALSLSSKVGPCPIEGLSQPVPGLLER